MALPLWHELYVYPIMIGVAAAGYFINRRLQKRRTEALSKIAAQFGFSFEGDLPIIGTGLSGFPTMDQGHTHYLMNGMRGEVDGLPFILFDHHYTTGSGKNSQSHRHTGFLFQSPRRVPKFFLCRENFLDRMMQAVAGDDVDFEEDPEFSKKFKLHASEASGVDSVRSLFHPGARAYLKNAGEGYSVQGNGKDMYVFRPGEMAEPGAMYEKLIAAKAVFDSFDLHA